MSVRQSIIRGNGVRRVTYRCDTQEEMDEQIRLHDKTCLNVRDTRRMLEVNHYPRGLAETGFFCGAYSEDRETMCDTTFLVTNQGATND